MSYLDKGVKAFANAILYLFTVIMLIFACLLLAYLFFSITYYNTLLFFILISMAFLLAVIILSSISAIIIYRRNKSTLLTALFSKLALKFIIPGLIYFSKAVGIKKDEIRGFYIIINNIIAAEKIKNMDVKDIFILVPHCLQNNECTIKITSNIDNCAMCGRCNITDILKISKKYGIDVVVATGGTVARSEIIKRKPKAIISVACERDLASGIADVTGIPVIGILNDRPFGPCKNTRVDVKKMEEVIIHCIEKKVILGVETKDEA